VSVWLVTGVQAAGKSTVADLLVLRPSADDHELGQTPRIGLWLDTSAQTAEQTVAEILRRRDEAEIGEDR
jgi:hypothetical protein